MEHKRKRSAEHRDPSGYAPGNDPYGGQYYGEGETPSADTPPRRRTADDRVTSSQTPRRRRTEDSQRASSDRPQRRRGAEDKEANSKTTRRRRPGQREQAPTGEGRRRRPADSPRPSSESRERRRTDRPKETSAQEKTKNSATREQRNTPPTVLSERSVKAAAKRKALRAENDRLLRLRRQQTRKAKRRTVKRIDKGLFKRLVIMAGVVVAVLLSMIIFFRVDNIVVRGSSYYTEEEVVQVCGVATGDNLLTLSRGKISGSIMAPLKYVESVKVERQLPNTLVIYVTESKPRYAVQDTRGDYFLMTAGGKIVEQISASQAKEFTVVQELVIQPPAIGEEIQIYAESGAESKASGQLTAMKTLLTAIEEANLGRHIASVQIPSSYKISLWYEDRFLVELANTSKIDRKLEYLKIVVEKQEAYVTGTVDLSFRDGEKAIMLPEG